MNRPQRNRSPGNLKFAGQKEAIGKDLQGFAIFPDGPSGWRALANQIKLDQDRDLTFEQFINKYAPPSENNTESYLIGVVRGLKAQKSDKLTDFSPYAIAGVMALFEGYYAT